MALCSSIVAVNALQAALKSKTRLGIPASIFAEITHSGGFVGSTVFPMPITTGGAHDRLHLFILLSLGCVALTDGAVHVAGSWNTSLMEAIGA